MNPSAPHGIVTFLFADVEGSTKLAHVAGDDFAEHIATFRSLIRPAIGSLGGYEVTTEGDSVFAAFSSARDAVTAAIRMQTALEHHPWPVGATLRVRIGLHTGSASVVENNYLGLPVHVAERICSAGHGGQILLSDETARASTHPSGMFKQLGEFQLREVPDPVRIVQILDAALPSEFPALRTRSLAPTNLPTRTSTFVGRTTQIADLYDAFTRSRAVTLTGSGGVGKTRLAIEFGHDALSRFNDGAWLVDLAPLGDPELILHVVASVLSVREAPERTVQSAVVESLSGKELLLIFDNCEQLIDAVAGTADDLLAACAGLHILATSREALRISGEHILGVPPLRLADPSARSDEVAVSESGQLFVARAQAARSDFTLDEDNSQAIASICARLDGIPLAIELAAARSRTMTPAEILAGLHDRFRLLKGGARTALPRQQTLRGALDWSYDALEAPERTAFDRASVFAASFTVDAAEAICAGASLQSDDIRETLDALVDRSLMTREDAGQQTRYRMLETMRAYGLERLEDEPGVRARHFAYFADMGARAEKELSSPEQTVWLRRFQYEVDDVRSAFGWGMGYNSAEAAALAAGLLQLWVIRGEFAEGRSWLERALEYTDRTAIRAKALNAAGGLALYQNDFTGARAYFEESLSIARDLDDRRGMAVPMGNLGFLTLQQGNLVRAGEYYKEALVLVREMQDGQVSAHLLNNLGYLAFDQGDFLTAEGFFEEVNVVARALGDVHLSSNVTRSLASVATMRGTYDAARKLYEETLITATELGDRRGISRSKGGIGACALHLGDDRVARAALEEALAVCRELADVQGEAYELYKLGGLAFALNDVERAQSCFDDCLTLSRGVQYRLGCLLGHDGLARVALSRGETSQARRNLHGALEMERPADGFSLPVVTVEGFSDLAMTLHEDIAGVRLLGAAAVMRASSGRAPDRLDAARLERMLGTARARLSAREFDEGWTLGQRAPLEETLALSRTI